MLNKTGPFSSGGRCSVIAPPNIFPPIEVATVAGLENRGVLGGVIFSAVAGAVPQHTHSYAPLFIISGTFYLVALFVFDRLAGCLPDVVPV